MLEWCLLLNLPIGILTLTKKSPTLAIWDLVPLPNLYASWTNAVASLDIFLPGDIFAPCR